MRFEKLQEKKNKNLGLNSLQNLPQIFSSENDIKDITDFFRIKSRIKTKSYVSEFTWTNLWILCFRFINPRLSKI
jgi:hypothetical protein